jgi:hypothetical protein
MEKLYAGLDIHKEKLAGCIMDKDGNITREHTFPSSKKAVERFLCGIPSSGITIAIEACGMWRGIIQDFNRHGIYGVKLANPKKTHDIACKKKTDKVDAKTSQICFEQTISLRYGSQMNKPFGSGISPGINPISHASKHRFNAR